MPQYTNNIVFIDILYHLKSLKSDTDILKQKQPGCKKGINLTHGKNLPNHTYI